MENGTDKSSCSGEPMVAEIQSEDTGREAAISPLCPRPSSAQRVDQDVTEVGAADQWDTYINTQIDRDWDEFSDQRRAFCDEYLENGYDHCNSAEKNGYSRSRGHKLLQEPMVQEYIHWMETTRRKRSYISRPFLDAKLLQTLDEASGEVEVAMVNKDGEQFQAKKYNGQLKLAILQEMGKVSGISKPEIQEGAAGVTVVIDVGALLGQKNIIKEVN